MGANSTKLSANANKELIERLRSLEVKETEKAEVNEKFVDSISDAPVQFPQKALSVSNTQLWEYQLLKIPKNRLALSALSTADPKTVLTSRLTIIDDQQIFNVKIPLEGAPITNQRASGRCWLFASTNVFRVAMMKRYNLSKFELSQAYLFFYDKLEKANYFLEQVLDTVNEPLDGRLLQTLLKQPVPDGGQWDMVVNLVEKYGLVPQVLYPDSFNAQSSYSIDEIITTKLRENALQLRSMVCSGNKTIEEILSTQEKMVREIHLILTLTLGPPPAPNTAFTWNYLDKDGIAHELKTTPLEFAADLKSIKSIQITNSAVHDMISLINDPRNEYNTLLAVDRLGNIVRGRGVSYVNVSMKTIKEACIKMLQAGLPVFFGSDVGKYSSRKTGIMDDTLIDYELGFNVTLGMSKAERLMTGESSMTHAMVLTAVHIEDGKSIRWRVQNSWGEGAGTDGWFVMSDAWMDQFFYQAVVEPSFVSQEVRDVLKMQPKILHLWDPMGSLA